MRPVLPVRAVLRVYPVLVEHPVPVAVEAVPPRHLPVVEVLAVAAVAVH